MNLAATAAGRVGGPLRLTWLHAWIASERGRFAPWLTVAMGIGVATYFARLAEPPWWLGLALAAGVACLVRLAWLSLAVRGCALVLLAGSIGFGAAQFATWRALPLAGFPRTAVIVTGVVRGVDPLPEGRRITVADVHLGGGPEIARFVHVRLRPNDQGPLAAGDLISVRALLRPPAMPAYPGAWDLQRDAFYTGLGASGTALGSVELVSQAPPRGAARWLQSARDAIAGRILAALRGTEGAIAATLLTGETTAIPLADRAAFRDSGLAHLLAVAGLHIGIVMGLVMGGTRLALALSERAALFWPCKQVAAVAALLAGAGYLLLTGGHVPILRSFAMAALVTLGIALGRRAISLRGLSLAGIAIMLLAPQEVVGVGFQMSFAAVLALIAGYEAMRPALARLRGRGLGWHGARHGAALMLTSLLAGVASAPFAAYHFGHVQAYFILANLVAVPLAATWIMPAGMLALALMPFGLERLALAPMGLGIDAVLWVARSVSSLPAATIAVPHMPGWGLAAVGLGLAWLGLWRSRLRLVGVAVILLGLLSGLASPTADLLVSGDARLIALDGAPAYVQTRPGFAHFEFDSWQQYWATGLTTPFPEADASGDVRCTADGCAIHRRGAGILLARSLRPMDCAGAMLVVSAEPAAAVCPALPHIDRFTVWRNGAYAVWLRDGMATVLSDRDSRGTRPWVPPQASARGEATTLPLAATDTLTD